MSTLAATQIQKPTDEQAFERACVILWRCLLKDDNVQRNGRRGQRQNGVDLYGIRNRDPKHLVGIQCKLKGADKVLTEGEVRDEFAKALNFKPELAEYFIVTTSPDDVNLQEVARTLAAAVSGRRITFHVWGWETLQERISEHGEALNAFDPTYGPTSKEVLRNLATIKGNQNEVVADMHTGFSAVMTELDSISGRLMMMPDQGPLTASIDQALHAEIDGYRDLLHSGKPKTALELLQRLKTRVFEKSSDVVKFRIKANIASCFLALGEETKGAELMLEACEHAPTDQRAVANKTLALILRKQLSEAISFARESLAADPTNEWVANYFLQAAKNDDSIGDPIAEVPEAIRASAVVQIGYAIFLRTRGKIPEWWHASRAALAAKADDAFTKQFCAEADLDEITRDPHYYRTGLLTVPQRARLTSATNVLSEAWEKATSSEGKPDEEYATICCNLLAALRVLGRLEEAAKVANSAIAIGLAQHQLLTYIAAIALDAPDEKLAARIIPKLAATPDNALLQLRYYAQQGNWEKLASLEVPSSPSVPEGDQETFGVLVKIAKARVGPPKEVPVALEKLNQEVRKNPRGSILVADAARNLGLNDIFTDAFERAVRGIDARSHAADRHMVAMHAAKHERWDIVADLLDGYVDENVDSEALQALATALANDVPIRDRTIRFFARLPSAVLDGEYYLRAAGIAYFNIGDLDKAENFTKRAWQANPSNVQTLLTLLSTLHRLDRQDDIPTLLNDVDLKKLQGSARSRIFLAQEFCRIGRGKEAIQYAYDVLRATPNDPEALMAYFGLLMASESKSAIPTGNIVEEDYWVKLQSPSGENLEFIVEREPSGPENSFPPHHPIAAAVLKRAVGYSFDQQLPLDQTTTWQIAEVKHKYLWLLHRGLENFETKFPDAKGLYRLSVKEGDIQPFLDQIRRRAEANQEIIKLYVDKHVPLGMVISAAGNNVVALAQYIRMAGHSVTTCVGNSPERQTALRVISEHRRDGAVLDTYTAWVAADLKILDVLKQVFGSLAIARSTSDVLRTMEDEARNDGKESMSVGWHNGQFIREHFTAEQNEERAKAIGQLRRQIEQTCTVTPVPVPDDALQSLKVYLKEFDSHFLDPAILAENKYVLISDDLYFRQAARDVGANISVWLQAILVFALSKGLIDDARYAEAIVGLSAHRHQFITVDAKTLLSVTRSDSDIDLPKLSMVAKNFAAKTGEINSLILVAREYLNQLWVDPEFAPMQKMKATSLLLEQMLLGRWNNWAPILASISRFSAPSLMAFVRRWIHGHFLESARFDAELKEHPTQ